MLKTQLLHPQILSALGKGGHGGKVLIADGNYPHSTKRGPNMEIVYLNLAPGMVSVVDVLKTLVTAVTIETAEVMDYARSGPYAMSEDPPIWHDFRRVLGEAKSQVELRKIERFKFYDAASTPEVCLLIATGDERLYANLLLTMGVVQ